MTYIGKKRRTTKLPKPEAVPLAPPIQVPDWPTPERTPEEAPLVAPNWPTKAPVTVPLTPGGSW
jgi:hypothetical protein